MILAPPAARGRRRPSLTPMIDVVFLLLVFFMLASRFGLDESLPLLMAGEGTDAPYQGPPRLVSVAPDALRLNGVEMSEQALVARLRELTESPSDTIVLRPEAEAELQALVDAMAVLGAAGFTALVLVE